MAIQEECCYIGRGEIFLAECLTEEQEANGETPNYISVGNTENFNITSEVNTIVKKNYISKCGGVECTYSSLDDIQINLTLCCYKDLNVGLALSGDCIVIPAQEAVEAQTFTETFLLGDLPVALQGIYDPAQPYTLSIAGEDQDGASTPIIDGSTLTGFTDADSYPPESEVIFTYTTVAVEARPEEKKFNLFSCSQDVYSLQFRGCNAAKGNDGRIYTLDLYKVCFEPASEFQFITEEFGTIELVGRLLPCRDKVISDGTTNFPSEYGSWCITEAAV